MRKLIATLFMSVDGVVESPDKFVRGEMYGDFPPELDEALDDQDSVLLGRKIYEEWAQFWPGSTIEPFASFINHVPKYVVSRTLRDTAWPKSTLIQADVLGEVARLKAQPGKSIGVHGVTLIQSLLRAGVLDELRVVQVPVIVGSGRRLLDDNGTSIPCALRSARATRTGLNYLVYTPRP